MKVQLVWMNRKQGYIESNNIRIARSRKSNLIVVNVQLNAKVITSGSVGGSIGVDRAIVRP